MNSFAGAGGKVPTIVHNNIFLDVADVTKTYTFPSTIDTARAIIIRRGQTVTGGSPGFNNTKVMLTLSTTQVTATRAASGPQITIEFTVVYW